MMHLSVDVHCHWSENPPSYRIYLNDDMLTERIFRWPGYQNYIKEHIIVETTPGIHILRIENCSSWGTFKLDNLIVEDKPAVIHPNYPDPSGQKLTFISN